MKKTLKIITFILFFLGVFFTVKAFSFEVNACLDCDKKIRENDESSISESKQMAYYRKFQFHRASAEYALKISKSYVFLLPTISDKGKAEAFFQTAIAMTAAGTSPAKIAAGLASLFVTYGLAVMTEYHEMMSWYYKAMHHAELADFYLEAALKGNK